MDRLTVLMHETGHVLGFEHDEGVMAATLAVGTQTALAHHQPDLLSSLAAWDLARPPKRHAR